MKMPDHFTFERQRFPSPLEHGSLFHTGAEAQIVQAARLTGTDAARLLHYPTLRFADDANFRAAVLETSECANRDFVPECASGGRRPPSRHLRKDMQGIGDYLKDHHPRYRQPTMRKLYEKIRTLKETPHIGRPGRIKGTREILFSPMPYLAVYRVHIHARLDKDTDPLHPTTERSTV